MRGLTAWVTFFLLQSLFCIVFAVPEIINYQGKLLVDGSSFSGTGLFRFAIVDQVGTTTYWSNDGDDPPTDNVPVTVSDGLFHVILGSTNGMEPIPVSVFNTDELYLRIWFDDGENTMQQLSPDQPLTSSGFSHRSSNTDLLENQPGSYYHDWSNLTGVPPEIWDGFDDDIPDDDTEVPNNISIDNGTLYSMAGSGTVGINTTSPDAALTVNGAILQDGSSLLGDQSATHINLGRLSTAGASGSNVYGCTVSGGEENEALAVGATVGGGRLNRATGDSSTVAGGFNNEASGVTSMVGGGSGNTASQEHATIAGGSLNSVSGQFSFIGSGYSNTVEGSLSYAGGKRMHLSDLADRTFIWGHRDSAMSPIDTPNAFIIYTGNVGIGTAAPAEKFHILGDADTSVIALVEAQGTDRSAAVESQSTTGVRVRLQASTGDAWVGTLTNHDLRFITNNVEQMRLTGSGNIGLGTTNPGTIKLVVNGTAAKPGGGNWDVWSDARLKDITGKYTAGLDKIDRLQPVTYSYKKDNPKNLPNDISYTGLVAQEVREVIPEAVKEDADGYLMLDKTPIDFAMVNAIKELNKLVKQQAVQIQKMQQEIDSLKSN